MMKIANALSCLFMGALALSFNVAAQGASPTTDSAARTAASSDNPDAAKNMSRADRKYYEKIAQGNIAEIEAGKVAQEKAGSNQVKSFGQHMVTDHGKAQSELSDLAARKGITLPTEPDEKHKKLVERLKSLSGPEFDSEYMKKAGIEDHQAKLKLLKKIQKDAKDADLKALAHKMQPTVEEHLKMAQDLNK